MLGRSHLEAHIGNTLAALGISKDLGFDVHQVVPFSPRGAPVFCLYNSELMSYITFRVN